MLLIRDSIVAGLSRYQKVWKKYFKLYKSLECGVPGGRSQLVLWRAGDLSVPPSIKYVVIYSGTSNLDQDETKIMINGIMKIDKVFQEKGSRR